MIARLAADVPEVQTLLRTTLPLVWVLEDDKLGHTTQSVGLAEALGWPYARKALRFNAFNRLSNFVLGASLVSLDRRRSAPLLAPWPDLVVATGRRTAPVARWIRRQSHGRTRLVQLGRKGVERADDFDVSVTCSHFALPRHPRRIETRTPLTAIDDRYLQEAAEHWRGLFRSEPHPHVAMIVGGTSALHRFDTATAARMGREVTEFVRAAGGSLFVVTSPRTGASASAALHASLGGTHRFYGWRSGDPDNPYLGCPRPGRRADRDGRQRIDARRGRGNSGASLYLSAAGAPQGLRHHLRAWIGRCARRPHVRGGRLCAHLIDLGLVRMPRDLAALHRSLIAGGYAHPFGAPLDDAPHAPLREMAQVAERVRALFGDQ